MEDDPVLGEILTDYLQAHYQVDRVFDSVEAMNHLDEDSYDLLIFDINVPGQSGIELLRDLRIYHDTTPAIIITAYADTKHLQESFDAGAHDYIRKPFELEELRLRIEKSKVLFRIEQDQVIWLDTKRCYDPRHKMIQHQEQRSMLKPKEAQLLEYFLAHPSRVISAEELTQNIWTYDTIPTDATIRSHIRNLREIIGADKIVTQRGLGYRYE
jgi:DNA-binding response OmpR family regulator